MVSRASSPVLRRAFAIGLVAAAGTACVQLLGIEELPVDAAADGAVTNEAGDRGDGASSDGADGGTLADGAATRYVVWAGGYTERDDAGNLLSGDDVFLAKVNQDGSLEPWVSGPKLPPSTVTDAVFVENNRVHVLLDQNRVATSTFDGTGLSPFSIEATAFPLVSVGRCPAIFGNKVYVPGRDGTAIVYATIDPAGLGAWDQVDVTNAALQRAATGLLGSFLVAVDGRGSLFSSSLAGGVPAPWKTEITAPPDSGPRATIYDYFSPLVPKDGRLYLVGSIEPGNVSTNRVYYSSPSPVSAQLTWTRTENFPVNRNSHSALVVDKRLYVLGGFVNDSVYTTDVNVSTFNADGTLGAWTTSHPLPKARGGPCNAVLVGPR